VPSKKNKNKNQDKKEEEEEKEEKKRKKDKKRKKKKRKKKIFSFPRRVLHASPILSFLTDNDFAPRRDLDAIFLFLLAISHL
jgi:hypothetical protein